MIEVFVVQRSRLMAEVIASVLREVEDIRISGMATSANEAIQKIQSTKCDVVLVNANLPDNGAMRILETFKTSRSMKILLVEVSSLEEVILQYIEGGAAGYVLKEESLTDLLKNIRAVHQDEALISPEIAGLLFSRINELIDLQRIVMPDRMQYSELTQRENEVLDLLSSGLSNQAIAEKLVIELGTVKNHVHSILQKLQVDSRDQAAQYHKIMKKTPDESPPLQ